MRSPTWQPPTLYRKTWLSLILVVSVVVGVGGWLGSRLLERQAVTHFTEFLVTATRLMEPEVRTALRGAAHRVEIQDLAKVLGERAGYQVTLIDPFGNVLGDSEQTHAGVRLMDNHADRPEVRTAITGRVGTSQRHVPTELVAKLYVAIPVVEAGTTLGVLRVAVPLTGVADLRRGIRRAAGLGLVLGVGLALLVGAWSAKRLTDPLRQLADTARAYARGDFSKPAGDAPIREVHELAMSLNTMVQDVRRSIEALKTERNQAATILENMAEGIIALDAQGRLLALNPSAAALLGVPHPGALGRSLFEQVRQQDLQGLARQVLEQRRPILRELSMFQPFERLLRVHAAPCPPGGADGPAAILILQDITDTARYEQLRKDFVANVSHELKSPLTSIRGSVETLLHGGLDDPPHNREFVELIQEDVQRLTRLIDDVLALSQIESQAVPLRVGPLPLATLVRDVIATLQPASTAQGLAVSVEVPDDLVIHADPDRLRQVVTNLVDNAIKYNRTGGSLRVTGRLNGSSAVLEVMDTGIGIPAEDLPRIFERFYRVDKARSRALGGTGLGLAIVKHIVEAHGGSVCVTSQLHEGSTFSVTLPARG